MQNQKQRTHTKPPTMTTMSLLSPRSVAVIGASSDEKKVGHQILNNLLAQGFKGSIYPVNPKGGEIMGKAAFESIADIPFPVDLAIIVTPAATVEALLCACGEKGVPSVIVISAGFAETGAEGRALQEKLVTIAKKYEIALVGPNCLGLMCPGIGLNASFGVAMPPAGTVALLSQSGALGDAFVDRAEMIGLGLSFFASMGNKAAMDECDFLELCAKDPETRVIGLYVESITNGRRFLRLCKKIGIQKPIALLKAGTTERGRKAVSSHTGALAGSDAAVNAICAQAGIWRAGSSQEFLDLLRTLSTQPSLPSPRIAIITNAGGPGVLAADAAERRGLILASITPKHEKELSALLPHAASIKNPFDVLGDALADRFEAALSAMQKDPNIDGAVVVLTPQSMTPVEEIAQTIVRAKERHTLFPFVTCFMGGSHVQKGIDILHKNGIPNFSCPERAMRAMRSLLKKEKKPIIAEPTIDSRRAAKAKRILAGTGSGLLSENTTAKLFALYDLPLPHGEVATTEDKAVAIAEKIGYPVTAKVSAKDILHKTDVGGVRVNLTDEKQLRSAFADILKNAKKHVPKAHISGVLIQQFLPPGSEFIVGALKDESVGHLVMAGLGGIYTELFQDAVFRVAPLTAEEVYPLLAEMKSWKLLLGLRGKPALAIDQLAALIARVSLLVTECPSIREIDLNPIVVREKELVILDAKVVL